MRRLRLLVDGRHVPRSQAASRESVRQFGPAGCPSFGSGIFAADDLEAAYRGLAEAIASNRRLAHGASSEGWPMSVERALGVAAGAAGLGYPKPTIGAVLVSDGEGSSARAQPRKAVVALAGAGARRGRSR